MPRSTELKHRLGKWIPTTLPKGRECAGISAVDYTAEEGSAKDDQEPWAAPGTSSVSSGPAGRRKFGSHHRRSRHPLVNRERLTGIFAPPMHEHCDHWLQQIDLHGLLHRRRGISCGIPLPLKCDNHAAHLAGPLATEGALNRCWKPLLHGSCCDHANPGHHLQACGIAQQQCEAQNHSGYGGWAHSSKNHVDGIPSDKLLWMDSAPRSGVSP